MFNFEDTSSTNARTLVHIFLVLHAHNNSKIRASLRSLKRTENLLLRSQRNSSSRQLFKYFKEYTTLNFRAFLIVLVPQIRSSRPEKKNDPRKRKEKAKIKMLYPRGKRPSGMFRLPVHTPKLSHESQPHRSHSTSSSDSNSSSDSDSDSPSSSGSSSDSDSSSSSESNSSGSRSRERDLKRRVPRRSHSGSDVPRGRRP